MVGACLAYRRPYGPPTTHHNQQSGLQRHDGTQLESQHQQAWSRKTEDLRLAWAPCLVASLSFLLSPGFSFSSPPSAAFLPFSPFFCSLGWMSNVLGQLPLCLEALNYSTVPQAKASFSLEKKSGWWQRSPTKWVCDRLLAVCTHEIPQSTIPAPIPSKTGAGHGSPFILEPIFSFGKKILEYIRKICFTFK